MAEVTGLQVKLRNRRVRLLPLPNDEFGLTFVNLVDGKRTEKKIKLSKEAMEAIVYMWLLMNKSL